MPAAGGPEMMRAMSPSSRRSTGKPGRRRAATARTLWGAARAKIRPMRQVPGASIWWPIETDGSTAADAANGVIVLTFQAPLTFLNADGFSRQLLARIAQAKGVAGLVVLEAAGIVDIDFTAAQALRGVIEACRKAGIIFALARLESVAAQSALSRLGLKALIGEDHIFASVAQAVAALGPATDGQRLSVDRKRPPERPSPSTA